MCMSMVGASFVIHHLLTLGLKRPHILHHVIFLSPHVPLYSHVVPIVYHVTMLTIHTC